MRILIVDDEKQIRRILSMLLSEAGYEVATAGLVKKASNCKPSMARIWFFSISACPEPTGLRPSEP